MRRSQMIGSGVALAMGVGLVATRPGADLAPTGGQPATASPGPTTAGPGPTTAGPVTGGLVADPERLGEMPELIGIDGWLNTEASDLVGVGGEVKIVQFWTFGCVNCKATLPHLQGIYDRWHDRGLEIVGVHSPEFAYEADPAAVASAMDDLGVVWPVALDPERASFDNWQSGRRFWPRTFVVDQTGEIRFDHIGEGAYDELEATVAHLLDNGP